MTSATPAVNSWRKAEVTSMLEEAFGLVYKPVFILMALCWAVILLFAAYCFAALLVVKLYELAVYIRRKL
jgi:hypothetical protein